MPPRARRAFPASAPESPANRPRPAARPRARPAPPRPPRGLCAPHAAKPARARLPTAARKEGSGSPRPEAPAAPPGTAPCPCRPGENRPRRARRGRPPPVRRRPLDSGTAAARAAAFRCAPKGGSNPWAVPAGDRGPLSCEFSRNSGVGVLVPKQKKTAPKDDLCWYPKWLFEPVIAGALAAAFSCQFAGCDQLAKRAFDGADTQ